MRACATSFVKSPTLVHVRLWEDYRLSVIAHLAIPVWQQSAGLHAGIWWPHLHRTLAAFEDLDCAAFLS
jgi:hypothetical protein